MSRFPTAPFSAESGTVQRIDCNVLTALVIAHYSPSPVRKELTVRGIIIGIIITLVFTAANVYAGLKAALTFSTSIPAAVISMAILRSFRNATIQENNIVQTVASAAGTLSSIIFVLPGLIMIGYWTDFPFWTSFWICALGGILGVMYSIPLRRALVTNSDLPYPEGVACAEVLKVGSSGETAHAHDVEHGRAGLLAVLWGSIVVGRILWDCPDKDFCERRGGIFPFRQAADQSLVSTLASLCCSWESAIWSGFGSVLQCLLARSSAGVGRVPHFSALAGDLTMAAAAFAQQTWSTKGPFRWRRCDRDFGDLDVVQISKTSGKRPNQRDGGVACTQSRPSRYATNHRA